MRPAAGVQDTAGHPHRPGLVEIGEAEVDAQVGIRSLLADQMHGGEVEEDADGHGHDGVRTGGGECGRLDSLTQLHGGGEEDAAPLRSLGLVAHLLVGVGLEITRGLVLRLGEDQGVQDLRGPAVVRGRQGAPPLIHDLLGADQGDEAAGGLDRWVGVERDRVAVPHAEFLGEHGTHVVVQGAVVAAVEPLAPQLLGQLDLLGRLKGCVALVGQPQRLVVEILVRVALRLQERRHLAVLPHRPGVRAVVHLHVVAPALQSLVEVAGEVAGVAGPRAAQRLDVVQRVVRVLRAGQRTELRDPDVHLLGRLRVGGVQELELEAAEIPLRTRLGDGVGRRDVRDRHAGHGGDPDAAGDAAARTGVEEAVERVRGASRHGVAGDHVLADRVLVERGDGARGDDRDLARGHVLGAHHTLDAAVVVDVGVGVDHGRDGLVADMLADQAHGLARGLDRGHAVDDHQSGVALDDREVGDVVVAHLVDAVHDLVQAALADQLRLTPQARVHGVGRGGVVGEVVEPGGIEDHSPVRRVQLVGQGGDEPPVPVGEVLPVVHVVAGHGRPVRRGGGGRGALGRVGHGEQLPSVAATGRPSGTERAASMVDSPSASFGSRHPTRRAGPNG